MKRTEKEPTDFGKRILEALEDLKKIDPRKSQNQLDAEVFQLRAYSSKVIYGERSNQSMKIEWFFTLPVWLNVRPEWLFLGTLPKRDEGQPKSALDVAKSFAAVLRVPQVVVEETERTFSGPSFANFSPIDWLVQIERTSRRRLEQGAIDHNAKQERAAARTKEAKRFAKRKPVKQEVAPVKVEKPAKVRAASRR